MGFFDSPIIGLISRKTLHNLSIQLFQLEIKLSGHK